MSEQITSRANPICQHFRRLASSRSYREETGEFLCDSPKLLEEAVKWKSDVKAILFTDGAELPKVDFKTRLIQVSQSVMRAVSPMETPQGVVFSCQMGKNEPPEHLSSGRYLALDGVQDPGNVGTMIRTADAFACDGVFLLPGCADLYNPKTVRSAMGVHFRRAVYRCTLETLARLMREGQIPIYAAALGKNTVDLRDADLTCAAVIIGSEGRGISEQALSVCEKNLKIPMAPCCESLNAAAAAAVVLWEGWRLARGS